jgi:hypothetical protein
VRALGLTLIAALSLGACDRLQRGSTGESSKPSAQAKAAPQQLAPGTTPMNQRVAVLGFLNKRNGIARDITLRPGQAIRIKDAIVRLRACETTPPWEFDKLTGAFVQLDVQQPGGGGWRRVFSGWLYKESPSLNVVEHPVYDVWPKSCVMSFPDAPPLPEAPAASSNVSNTARSGGPTRRSGGGEGRPGTAEAGTAEPAAAAEPTAAVSNAT